jgi:hypothetical protein
MSKNAAYYRGYKIEGEKDHQGWLVRVSPLKPELPVLRRGEFRVTGYAWPQAVDEAVSKIDVLQNKASGYPRLKGAGCEYHRAMSNRHRHR